MVVVFNDSAMLQNIQAFPKQPILLGTVKQHVVGKEEEKQSVEVRGAVVSRDGYTFVSTGKDVQGDTVGKNNFKILSMHTAYV
jgi:hypothetical protein